MKVRLPHGGRDAAFELDKLVDLVRASGRNYIVVGAQNRLLVDHTKPRSLDYWLRTHYARYPDTKQATNEVADAIAATGRFEKGRHRCPDSGRLCKSLVLRRVSGE